MEFNLKCNKPEITLIMSGFKKCLIISGGCKRVSGKIKALMEETPSEKTSKVITGIDPKARGGDEKTAMEIATEYESEDVVSFLCGAIGEETPDNV